MLSVGAVNTWLCVGGLPVSSQDDAKDNQNKKKTYVCTQIMQIAQKLYQGVEIDGDTVGLITYMRTDGTNLSADAVNDFRNFIKSEYGNEYLPASANTFDMHCVGIS